MLKDKNEYKKLVKDINNPTIEELKAWMFENPETVDFDKNADGWALYHVLKLLLEDKSKED